MKKVHAEDDYQDDTIHLQHTDQHILEERSEGRGSSFQWKQPQV